MRACRTALFLVLLVWLSLPACARDLVSLTSLNWPPYTGFYLPGKGVTSFVVQRAFEEEGFDTSIHFFPWKRAVSLAERGDSHIGFFPEYPTTKHGKAFLFSEPVGDSVLRFIETVDAPIKWDTLDDLSGLLVGVVAGYVNTPEFDALVADGTLHVDATGTDVLNIRKVASGRVHTAVIDERVFRYLMKTEAQLADLTGKVRLSQKPLGNLTLHVCFRNTPTGQRLLEVFNRGLERVDVEQITKTYWDGLTY